jgi:hypothetical protein
VDAGKRIIEWLYAQQLKIDDHWALRTPEGFRWWADKQAQTVEVVGQEEGGPDGAVGYLVSVRTDVLRGVEMDEAGLTALNAQVMGFPSMAGMVYNEELRTLSLCSLARVWEENEEWLGPLLGMAAVLQIGEARALTTQLVDLVGGEAEISGHPTHGVRAQPDEMAAAVQKLVIPTGQRPSVWGAEQFEPALRDSVEGPVQLAPSPDGDGFAVEVPYGELVSRFHVLPAARHPLYGSGLLLLHQFPLAPPTEQEGAAFALGLNGVELTREPFGYGFGSYAWREGAMYFISFFPNAVFRQGMLPNLVVSCAQRSRSLQTALALGS